MATLPTRILEIEFDAGVWTNVTSDFVELSSRRGRNRESGAFETGQLNFTLRNDGRKYDPDNTAGPYYGKLRPNRRVRLRATYSAVTYPIFVGYIDKISQVGEGPNAASAVFQVSDFFKLLNRAELPVSAYAAEVAADNPVAWYRLDEPVGVTAVTDSIGGVQAAIQGAPTLGEPTLVSRDPGTAMTPVVAGDGIRIPSQVTPSGTGAFTVEFLFRTSATPSFRARILAMPGTEAYEIGLGQNIFGSTPLYMRINNVESSTWSVPHNIGDGLVHHAAFVRSAAGQMRIYVDGVDWTTTVGTDTSAIPVSDWYFGAPRVNVEDVFAGTLDELAIYNTALSAARIAAHAAVVRTPWNGDTPGARLARIFSLVATPGSYVLDTGEPTFQSSDLGGTALGYAQKVEETALGLLFVDREGDVTFIGRNTSITGAYLTSKATLVDDDSGAGIPYRQADADVDEANIITRATVSRAGSVAIPYFDAAAKAEFGWLDETHDGLLHDSDAYSRSYAEWIVSTHKAPGTRVGTVLLELTKDPAAMYPAVLDLEIGDRVTWKRKPQNVGAVTTVAMRVEAITHETGGHYWRTRLQLSPFNLAAGLPVGIWDVTNWDQSVWGI